MNKETSDDNGVVELTEVYAMTPLPPSRVVSVISNHEMSNNLEKKDDVKIDFGEAKEERENLGNDAVQLENDLEIVDMTEVTAMTPFPASRGASALYNTNNIIDEQSKELEESINSLMSFVLLSVSVEAEYPSSFYAKLFSSPSFELFRSRLSEDQKLLLEAMMSSEDTNMNVRGGPEQSGEIFLEDFSYD